MQIEFKREEFGFKPVEISIKIETQRELEAFSNLVRGGRNECARLHYDDAHDMAVDLIDNLDELS